MKRSLVLALLMSIIVTSAGAQEEDPIPPKRSRAMKFGGLAGLTPGWLKLNMDPINTVIRENGGAELSKNGVFLLGGGGSAYIMLVPNLRIGGMGVSGSLSSTRVDAQNVRRDVQLTVGFGGVTVEYVIPLVERLDLSIGALLGTGGIDLVLRQDSGVRTWTGEWQSYQTGNYNGSGSRVENITRKLTGSFFIYQPSVNIEYVLLGWLAIRGGVSYLGMAAPSWSLDEKYDLIGVPSDVSGRGFMVNGGLLLGTF